jgi:Zn finger protein HypA/HybF involved in hydrogenase expression
MTKYFAAAVSAIFFLAANPTARSDTVPMPSEKNFPSSVGEVVFHHQMHIKDLSIKCVECHHQIDAKKLATPHPDYFKSSSIKCEICHMHVGEIKQGGYICSACHSTKPMNIADETLSSKVVVHKQCWKCHQVGTGTQASKGCEKCHSGRRTF